MFVLYTLLHPVLLLYSQLCCQFPVDSIDVFFSLDLMHVQEGIQPLVYEAEMNVKGLLTDQGVFACEIHWDVIDPGMCSRWCPSSRGVYRSWFMTFACRSQPLPLPPSTSPTSLRFMCEWWTRSVGCTSFSFPFSLHPPHTHTLILYLFILLFLSLPLSLFVLSLSPSDKAHASPLITGTSWLTAGLHNKPLPEASHQNQIAFALCLLEIFLSY